MKFASFDELINFLHGKDFNNLEFTIDDCAVDDTIVPVPDSNIPVQSDAQNLDGTKVSAKFNSLYDNPVIEFEIGPVSTLAVKEFDYVQNACSTSRISFCNRTITIGICESVDGQPTAKFDVTVNGVLYTNKEFILSSSDTAKNIISI